MCNCRKFEAVVTGCSVTPRKLGLGGVVIGSDKAGITPPNSLSYINGIETPRRRSINIRGTLEENAHNW
jgi:hypothetical protein